MSEQELPEEGLNEADFSTLMDNINTMAPLVRGILGGKEPEGKRDCSKRETLLLALKPYLSPERSAMVEYLIRMGRISDMLHTLH